MVPPMVAGLGVQVQADDGQRSGSESCQSIDLFGEQIGHDGKAALCVEHETDQVRLGGTAGVTLSPQGSLLLLRMNFPP